MDGGSFVIDEAEGTLEMLLGTEMIKNRVKRTAIVCSPHFDVSTPRLFRLADHSRGVTLSVATYMYVSVFLSVKKLPKLAIQQRVSAPRPYRTP